MDNLTASEAERLALLAEECAEVVQAVTKILRHGYRSVNPDAPDGPTNRETLESEIGDVQFAVQNMLNLGDVRNNPIVMAQIRKAKKWEKYSHHQRPSPAEDLEKKP